MAAVINRHAKAALLGHVLALTISGGLTLQGAKAQSSGYSISFANQCSKSVRIAVSYRDNNGRWIDRGMYDFVPGERSALKDVWSNNRIFYYYAETTDGSVFWGANNQPHLTVNGRTYRPRKVEVKRGDTYYVQTLTCSNQSSNNQSSNKPAENPSLSSGNKGRYPSVQCNFGGIIGKLQIRNDSPYQITASLWHPDSQQIYQTINVPAYTSSGPSYSVGDDWGVQLGSSSVKCIGRSADFDRINNIFRIDSTSFHGR